MNIAIIGATSQIAKDLIVSFSLKTDENLCLFARRPKDVVTWLSSIELAGRYPVNDFSQFAEMEFDAIINFIGVGNPAQAKAMGNSIFDLTLRFDEMVLSYLRYHQKCRYLFLSSGAAYGSSFHEPATRDTPAVIKINNLKPSDWYGVAKLHAECRHRSYQELSIVDLRVFNYFSRTQDLTARFLISDILRAICEGTVLQTSSEYIVRDFLHPDDFYQLVVLLLSAPPINTSLDCYSQSPIDKPSLLAAMQERFGLKYETTESATELNSTGNKPFYYSLDKRAADFGYQPGWTSLEGILWEAAVVLKQPTASKKRN